MKNITAHAHAKINLSLDVLNRRPDGYHTVRMIMQSLDLKDTLLIEKTDNRGIRLIPKNPEQFPDVTWDERNLIYRAAQKFLEAYSIKNGVTITIEKNIPSSAGLAGGSSDAAATLRGLNDLFEIKAPLQELQTLGVTLGADIPYCLMLGTALSEGIGEILTPLSPAPELHCTLVKPKQGVSTKYVYEHLDLTTAVHPDTDCALLALEKQDISLLCNSLGNILEPVALTLCPEITEIEKKMKELGAKGCLMSGSGPTVFGLFTDADQAAKVAGYFHTHGYENRSFATKFHRP